MTLTLGERLKNPGNIVRDTTPWLGLVPLADMTQRRFCEFDSEVHGIRALCKVLLAYTRLDGCRTLEQVVNRYAPPVENDTGAYVADVAQRTNLAPDNLLDLERPGDLALLAKAIIWHENGRCIYDDATIDQAVALALG